MTKLRSSIQLNGHRYNNHNGQLVEDFAAPSGPAMAVANAKRAGQPQPLRSIAPHPVLDGFIRQPMGPAQQLHSKTHKSQTLRRTLNAPSLTAAMPKPGSQRPQPTVKRTAAVAAQRQTVKSQTLMRSAVSKPVIDRKPALKTQPNMAAMVAKPAAGISSKRMSDVVDGSRLERAIRTPQHSNVSRFPKNNRLIAAIPAPAVAMPVVTAPQATSRPRPLSQPVAATDIFSQAIRNSTSHQQTYQPPKHHRRPGRLIMTGAISLTLLVAAVGVAFLNRTNIQMQFASAQAGFKANVPAYVPPGYSLQNISQQPGKVVVNYQAAAVESRYSLTQQPSAWNSQTLLDSFVSNLKQNYQTYQRGGQTVYVYGGNATWVSNGVWYRLQSSGVPLSSQQLLSIIASL